MRSRQWICLLWVSEVALVCPVSANELTWLNDVEKGMAEARKKSVPVLFYIDAEDDASDAEQEKSFTDPTIQRIVTAQFVPLRLGQSQTTDMMMEQMKVQDWTPACVVVATSRGRLIATIPAEIVADPQTFAGQLTSAYQRFGTELFENRLRTSLEDESAKPEDVRDALKLIAQLSIAEADEAVIDLSRRKGVSQDVKTRAYRTLAALSTERSVKALMKAAPGDEAAAGALSECTPVGAELMMSEMDAGDEAERTLVCAAVAKICDVAPIDPQLLATGADKEERKNGIARLETATKASAKRWRENNVSL